MTDKHDITHFIITTIYREDVYRSPDATSHSNGSLLNSYCVEAVCYNNIVNSTMFTPEDCSGGSCVSEQLSPTVPDVDDHPHWFFSYALFIGGSIHLLLSLLMLIFFFALNISDFGTPDKDFDLYEYVKLHCNIRFIVNLFTYTYIQVCV